MFHAPRAARILLTVFLLATGLLAVAAPAQRAYANTTQTTFTASSGYSGIEGPDWGYQERTPGCASSDCYYNLSYGNSVWTGPDGAMVSGDQMRPGSADDVLRTWVVRQKGTVNITGRIFRINPSVSAPVIHVSIDITGPDNRPDGRPLWSQTLNPNPQDQGNIDQGNPDQGDPGNELGVWTDSEPSLTNVSVQPGDYIHFSVSADSSNWASDLVGWDPTVAYTHAAATNTVYYVDNQNSSASDGNAGTSPSAPLKTVAPLNNIRYFGANVKILFAQNETFSGGLNIQMNGTAQQPDEIGTFVGAAGQGAGPKLYDLAPDGYRYTDIMQLANSSYLMVDNIAFWGTFGQGYGSSGFQPGNYDNGLLIYSTAMDGAQWQNITISHCGFTGSQRGVFFDDSGRAEPSVPDGFANVTVADSIFNSVWQTGAIVFGNNPFAGGPVNENTNVTMARNQFYSIYGSPAEASGAAAVAVYNTTGIDIDSNVAKNIGGFQESPLQSGNYGGVTAIGVANARNFVIQRNEVTGTNSIGTSVIDYDGSAIDADQDAQNGEIAFNLTYYNRGPGIELGTFGGKYTQNIAIHHNVSVNDARGLASTSQQGSIRLWGGLTTAVQIFNNTIYSDMQGSVGQPSCISFEGNPDGTAKNVQVWNNILKTGNGVPMIWTVYNHTLNGGPVGNTHIDPSTRFEGNLYDSSGASLLISNDDTKGHTHINPDTGQVIDVTSLAQWRLDGQESYQGNQEGVTADAGLASNIAAFDPAQPYLPGAPVASVTSFDLTAGSAARGHAVSQASPWSIVTLTGGMTPQELDFHQANAATVTDIGAVP